MQFFLSFFFHHIIIIIIIYNKTLELVLTSETLHHIEWHCMCVTYVLFWFCFPCHYSPEFSLAEICFHWNNQAEGSVPLSVFVCWIRSDARLYVLWHDEQVEDADQSREDQRQKHAPVKYSSFS